MRFLCTEPLRKELKKQEHASEKPKKMTINFRSNIIKEKNHAYKKKQNMIIHMFDT